MSIQLSDEQVHTLSAYVQPSAPLVLAIEFIVAEHIAAALERAAAAIDEVADENRAGEVELDAAVYDAAARIVRSHIPT